MEIPFTVEQFMEVFKNYNNSVFPVQVILYLLAAVSVFLSIKRTSWSNKAIAVILSFFWIWMGIVYHIIHFSVINKAAYIFGTAFIFQGMLFLHIGFFRQKIMFRFRSDIFGITGSIFLLFALILYPVLGYFQGHIYPSSPTFGLPCPTTIFTFGLLFWTERKFPITLLIIPFTWSIIGLSAVFMLGIKEDISLLITALIAATLLIIRNRKTKPSA
jgi:hypothetical protein